MNLSDLTNSDAISIVNAFATFSAVVVAMVIARNGSRKEKIHAEQKASLSAARVSVVVEHIREKLASVTAVMDFSTRLLESEKIQFIELISEINEPLKILASYDLSELIPLDSRCSHRLARAVALLQGLSCSVQLLADSPEWIKSNKSEENKLLAEWRNIINEALLLLEVALNILHRAAKISAPVPSMDEIYQSS